MLSPFPSWLHIWVEGEKWHLPCMWQGNSFPRSQQQTCIHTCIHMWLLCSNDCFTVAQTTILSCCLTSQSDLSQGNSFFGVGIGIVSPSALCTLGCNHFKDTLRAFYKRWYAIWFSTGIGNFWMVITSILIPVQVLLTPRISCYACSLLLYNWRLSFSWGFCQAG